MHNRTVATLLVAAVLLAAGAAAAAAPQPQDAPVPPPAPAAPVPASSCLSKLLRRVFWFMGPAPQAQTVAELAAHAPGNMSILINALNRVDLQQVLANPDWTATIMAPTNRAFEAALLKLKLTPAQLYADKAALTNILSYHTITDGALAAGDLKDGQTLNTVNKQTLTVHVDKVAGTTIQGTSETAKVVAADIRAGKAIIHVIDTVLLPPKPTKEQQEL